MGSFSDTPALVATGTIAPFRFVKLSAENSGAVATATTDIIIGITDGSTNAFNSADHCVDKGPITLQGGDVVLVEASAAITYGDRIGPTTAGKAITISSTSAKLINFVALETASGAGVIIRAFRTCSAISA
jgi:hypothetical protein